jgi:hypothetical protein
VPLAVHLTDANRNDSQAALALVDPIQPVRDERGRPRRQLVTVCSGIAGFDAIRDHRSAAKLARELVSRVAGADIRRNQQLLPVHH